MVLGVWVGVEMLCQVVWKCTENYSAAATLNPRRPCDHLRSEHAFAVPVLFYSVLFSALFLLLSLPHLSSFLLASAPQMVKQPSLKFYCNTILCVLYVCVAIKC